MSEDWESLFYRPGLLPCPFCGGAARLLYSNDNHHRPYVECGRGYLGSRPGIPCPGTRMYMWNYKTEEEAIAAWNTRATCEPR